MILICSDVCKLFFFFMFLTYIFDSVYSTTCWSRKLSFLSHWFHIVRIHRILFLLYCHFVFEFCLENIIFSKYHIKVSSAPKMPVLGQIFWAQIWTQLDFFFGLRWILDNLKMIFFSSKFGTSRFWQKIGLT